jgi:hypothetical protein
LGISVSFSFSPSTQLPLELSQVSPPEQILDSPEQLPNEHLSLSVQALLSLQELAL